MAKKKTLKQIQGPPASEVPDVIDSSIYSA